MYHVLLQLILLFNEGLSLLLLRLLQLLCETLYMVVVGLYKLQEVVQRCHLFINTEKVLPLISEHHSEFFGASKQWVLFSAGTPVSFRSVFFSRFYLLLPRYRKQLVLLLPPVASATTIPRLNYHVTRFPFLFITYILSSTHSIYIYDAALLPTFSITIMSVFPFPIRGLLWNLKSLRIFALLFSMIHSGLSCLYNNVCSANFIFITKCPANNRYYIVMRLLIFFIGYRCEWIVNIP